MDSGGFNGNVVISIHGIFGTVYPHYPLVNQLEKLGYETLLFDYSSWKSIEEIAQELSKFIDEHDPGKFPVILIGHSAGGRIALECKHASIKGIITIASPINGSYLASWVCNLPIASRMLTDLAQPWKGEVTVLLVCISTSFYGSFDGRMWASEMVHEKANENLHLNYSNHSGLQMVDPRMRKLIISGLNHIVSEAFPILLKPDGTPYFEGELVPKK